MSAAPVPLPSAGAAHGHDGSCAAAPVRDAAAPLPDAARRRRLRRNAWVWSLIAAAFYLGFIALTLVRGWK